ncbi:hypothetical protein AAG906_025012 [Vitis piasezkii]
MIGVELAHAWRTCVPSPLNCDALQYYIIHRPYSQNTASPSSSFSSRKAAIICMFSSRTFGEMSSVVPAISSTLVKKYSISIPRASSFSLRKMTHTHRTSNSVFSQPQLLLRDPSDPPARPPPEFPSVPSYEPDVPPEMPGSPTAPELQPIPQDLPADPPPNSPGPNPGPDMPRPPIPSPPGPEVPLPVPPIPPPDILPPQPPEILPPKPPEFWPTEPPEIEPPELPELPEIKPPNGPFFF